MTIGTLWLPAIASKRSFPSTPPVGSYVAWYDANQINGFANGASLTSWADASGNGHTLTQFSTHTLPTYSTTSTIDGLPTVHFSGSDCCITDNTGFGSLSTPTVIVIGKNNQTPGYNFNWTDSQTATEVSMGASSSGPWLIYAGSSVISTPFSQDTSAHFFAGVYNGASSGLYVDSDTASVTGNPGSNALNKLMLGNRQAADIGLNGLIGEVIVYSTALSAANVASLHTYAKQKWGVA